MDEEQLELVTLVVEKGGFVGVVYVGYGLVWTSVVNVVMRHRLEDPEVVQDDTEEDACDALSSLALRFAKTDFSMPPAVRPFAHRVATLLPMFASSTLATLTLERVILSRNDFIQLLNTFTRLHTLHLDCCVIQSIDPLIHAYKHAKTNIAVLSLVRARAVRGSEGLLDKRRHLQESNGPKWLKPLLSAFANGVGRHVLRDLSIDIRRIQSKAAQHTMLALVAVVATSLPLSKLYVTCPRSLRKACIETLGPLRDQVVRGRRINHLAVLSVLQVFNCAIPEITGTVLKMAEGSVRTISIADE